MILVAVDPWQIFISIFPGPLIFNQILLIRPKSFFPYAPPFSLLSLFDFSNIVIWPNYSHMPAQKGHRSRACARKCSGEQPLILSENPSKKNTNHSPYVTTFNLSSRNYHLKKQMSIKKSENSQLFLLKSA